MRYAVQVTSRLYNSALLGDSGSAGPRDEFESGPHATCHPAEKEEPSNTRFVFHLVQSCTRNKKRREFSILFCNVFPRKYLLN
jgi:hypothetical protein